MPAPKKKPSIRIKEVRLEDVYVDPDYQRPDNRKKVAKIVSEWRESRVRPPMLSERSQEGKKYAAYDGQHTILAAIEKGYTHLDCVVHSLSKKEEAEDFHGINTSQTKPNTRDRFKARLTAEEPMAQRIEEILNRHGLSGVPNSGMTVLKAIGAAEEVVRKYGYGVLDDALHLSVLTWGAQKLRRYPLIAVAQLVDTFGDRIDQKRFVAKFSVEDPALLEASAKAANRQRHYLTIPTALAEEMLRLYNHGLSGPRKLDLTVLANAAA